MAATRKHSWSSGCRRGRRSPLPPGKNRHVEVTKPRSAEYQFFNPACQLTRTVIGVFPMLSGISVRILCPSALMS
jgi:hypothetical protein